MDIRDIINHPPVKDDTVWNLIDDLTERGDQWTYTAIGWVHDAGTVDAAYMSLDMIRQQALALAAYAAQAMETVDPSPF
jgi:hypothetical protein